MTGSNEGNNRTSREDNKPTSLQPQITDNASTSQAGGPSDALANMDTRPSILAPGTAMGSIPVHPQGSIFLPAASIGMAGLAHPANLAVALASPSAGTSPLWYVQQMQLLQLQREQLSPFPLNISGVPTSGSLLPSAIPHIYVLNQGLMPSSSMINGVNGGLYANGLGQIGHNLHDINVGHGVGNHTHSIGNTGLLHLVQGSSAQVEGMRGNDPQLAHVHSGATAASRRDLAGQANSSSAQQTRQETQSAQGHHLESVDGPLAVGPSGTMYKAKKRRKYDHDSFPVKLYKMLLEVEKSGEDDVVSFTIDGVGFEIHQPDVFAERIIPKFFRHKRLASFRRQLSMYGFRRPSSKGKGDIGAYVHELFVKGRPDLCRKMKRVSELEAVVPPSATINRP